MYAYSYTLALSPQGWVWDRRDECPFCRVVLLCPRSCRCDCWHSLSERFPTLVHVDVVVWSFRFRDALSCGLVFPSYSLHFADAFFRALRLFVVPIVVVVGSVAPFNFNRFGLAWNGF